MYFMEDRMQMTINLENIKYFIYARRSTDREDRQLQSIPGQKKELFELAEYYKLKIVKIFEEYKSAKHANQRPTFTDMMKRIEYGEANGILCWDVDRLSRNYRDAGWIQDLLNESVIKSIRTPRKEYLPTDDLVGLCVESSNAAEYSKKLSINVKRGFRLKLERGWHPHRARNGYINIKKDGENIIAEDPDRFDMVQKMWEMVLSERYNVSDIEKIADKEWGFVTRKTKRMGGVKLTKARLYEMFSSPFYKGVYIKDGVEYQMNHNPIVTPEEWERVQYIIGRKKKPRSKAHSFAFRGPIFCGECGCLITAEEKTKEIIRTGQVKKYTYYHCTRRRKGVNCSQHRSIREDNLEAQILDWLGKVKINPKFIGWALEVLEKSQKDEIQNKEAIYANLQKRIIEIEKKMRNLIDMKLKGQLTDDEFNSTKNDLLNEKSNIETRLKDYNNNSNNRKEWMVEASNFTESLKIAFKNGSTVDKRTILQALGDNITLLDGRLYIELYEWLSPKITKPETEDPKTALEEGHQEIIREPVLAVK
jgi:site-specific DNA recombinase